MPRVDNGERLNMRLPVEMLGRVDAFAEAMRARTGLRVSRADAARVLLGRALDAAPELKSGRRGKGG